MFYMCKNNSVLQTSYNSSFFKTYSHIIIISPIFASDDSLVNITETILRGKNAENTSFHEKVHIHSCGASSSSSCIIYAFMLTWDLGNPSTILITIPPVLQYVCMNLICLLGTRKSHQSSP